MPSTVPSLSGRWRLTRTALLLVLSGLGAGWAHGQSVTWYFQFDPANFVKLGQQYTEAMNKVNQSSVLISKAEDKSASTQDTSMIMGPKVQGDLVKGSPEHAQYLVQAAQELKDELAARSAAGASQNPTSYDLYLSQVASWRAQLETFRVKTDALADSANSRPLSYTEWLAMQTQYQLALGQIQTVVAAIATAQAEIKVNSLQQRAQLREQLLQLQRMNPENR